MKKYICLLASALTMLVFSPAGYPQTPPAPNASYTWTPPTQFENNASLASSQIAGYEIGCRFVPVGGGADQACTLSKTAFAGGAAASDSLFATIPTAGGQLCLTLRTRATAAAGGGLSSPSTEKCKSFGAVNPNPPTNLQVVKLDINVNLNSGDGFNRSVAYLLNGSERGDLAGFVKVGTPCFGKRAFAFRGQNYYNFLLNHPTRGISNISWNTKPVGATAVVAPCA